MKNSIFSYLILLGVLISSVGSEPSNKPNQKIFLFLKEPLRNDESIVIRLNRDLEEKFELTDTEKNKDLTDNHLNKIIYQKKRGRKNEINLYLAQGGHVVVDVYDFYGKKLGNLYDGYSEAGSLLLNENDNWNVDKPSIAFSWQNIGIA